jgi:putative membrane protein
MIMLLACCLVLERIRLAPMLTRRQIGQLAKIDGIYGLVSLLQVSVGFSLWFGVGKGAAYYSGNPIFWAKIGLFSALGIASLYPTIFFLRQREGIGNDSVILPKWGGTRSKPGVDPACVYSITGRIDCQGHRPLMLGG